MTDLERIAKAIAPAISEYFRIDGFDWPQAMGIALAASEAMPNRWTPFTDDELCAIDDSLSPWLLERQLPDIAARRLSEQIRIELGRRASSEGVE